jgi:hypothetical protein
MAFAVTEKNGVQRVLRPGDIIDSTDPVVKGKPEDWFEAVEVTAARTTLRAVEQATSAPGEKRSVAKSSAAAKH